jgi:myo-inositol 2-dehydrogenase/D-chiro-inositol 1-dehydrogenase
MSYIEESGGLFVDGTIHELDEARWMVGEIEEVSAFGSARSDPAFAKMRDVDTALVFLRFVNGAIGVIDTSRVAGYGWEASTEVMGSGATLRIARHRRTHVDWLRPGTVASDWVGSFIESHAEAYLLEMEAFAAAIRDDVTPAATGEDALAAFVLAEACTTSFRDARRVRLEISDSPYGPRYAVADATRTTQ